MKEFLPIGSVVLLKESTKRIMIFGRLQKEPGDSSKVWDYVGCPYPEGNISPEESLLFNHDTIEMVFFIGFQDVDEFQFKGQLIKAYEEISVKDNVGII